MRKQPEAPRSDEAEAYWKRLQTQGTLRASLDHQAARIPEPNWETIRAQAVRFPKRSTPGPWLAMLAAAACLGVVFWSVSSEGPNPHSIASSSVVDQIFRSTANQESLENGLEKPTPVAFSPVLKTIDAGISHWDDVTSVEE